MERNFLRETFGQRNTTRTHANQTQRQIKAATSRNLARHAADQTLELVGVANGFVV
jgi:hypothetical protein